jgi:hypothetical protein
MMMRILSLVVASLLFSGCMKNYDLNSSKLIVIRSPQIKYADLGYIRGSGDDLKIELYAMGNVVKSININNFICVDDGCMLKSVFNAKYLNANYPSDILENVITGHAIYDGKNLRKLYDGYVQDIRDENVDIEYEVTKESIRFRDRKNAIFLKIASPSR